MKAAIVFGTRPEIIKVAPIIKRLNKKNCISIYTGQHYDANMSLKFFKDLGLGTPDYVMKLKKVQNTTTDGATRISEVMEKLAKIITSLNLDTVIVQGDTNSVLAAAITSLKCEIPVCHVEAGLRSYDWRMPEEHTRIMIDHISEILFPPTPNTKKILETEHVHGKSYVTGNTSIDSINDYIKIAEKKSTIKIDEDFILTTLHRGSNVDNKKSLQSIISALLKSDTKMIFPVHPRTMKKLYQFGLYNKIENSKNIKIIPPVGYFDMLYLMKKCKFIVSDSGGIQEESTAPQIRKKVLVIRDKSDRPEAIDAGYSDLVGTKQKDIIYSIKKTLEDPKIMSRKNPYGKGKASQKIINILKKNF
jgi:UDP-N-acetylglucosamine 2-epimerase (non-hydrolysing)